MSKLTRAKLDRAVANALGLKSVNNCEKWRVGMNEEAAYLGDGVYASFDGYQIWLAVNHHENKQVAIEPKVMESLMAYAEKVWGKTK